MADNWLPNAMLLFVVFLTTGGVGIIIGINMGERLNRKIAETVISDLLLMLAETRKTLEEIRDRRNDINSTGGFNTRTRDNPTAPS